MRNCIIIAVLLLGSWQVHGSELLKCLGREELQIHKNKTDGPLAQLNQTLVNEVVRTLNVGLKPQYYEDLCQSKEFSPSLNFIKLLLIEGESIFALPKKDPQSLEYNLNKTAVSTLRDEVPHIFFKYLSTLQGMTKKPRCLEDNIPEIRYFMERYRFLEEDVSADRLITDKHRHKINAIFSQLKSFDRILKSCEIKKSPSKR